MSPDSTDTHFSSINSTCQSLSALYFRPAGIFTNALVTKPDITQLLRDADAHENALYRVDRYTGRPERKDGTRGVVDQVGDELEHNEVQRMLQEQEELAEAENGHASAAQDLVQQDEIQPVVVIPRPLDASSQQPAAAAADGTPGSAARNLLSRLTDENYQDYDISELSDVVLELLQKYPVPGVLDELERLSAQHEQLLAEIAQNQHTIESQRDQLVALNGKLTENSSFDQSATAPPPPIERKTAKQLIELEQHAINQLEIELEQFAAK